MLELYGETPKIVRSKFKSSCSFDIPVGDLWQEVSRHFPQGPEMNMRKSLLTKIL